MKKKKKKKKTKRPRSQTAKKINKKEDVNISRKTMAGSASIAVGR